MEPKVKTRQDGRILLVELTNPPVNALAHAVRQALLTIVTEAASNETIDALVITGSGKIFCGGAEIREFGQTPQAPQLTEVVDAIEASPKPVVAALNGAALGGGLEIALGCHARLALRSAKMALPEVKLGLLPGAGGTQRLPRLIGLRKALPFITGGEQMKAEDAFAIGLVDALFDGDIVERALSHARELVEKKISPRRISELTTALDLSRAEIGTFEEEAAALLKKARGLEAPAACVEAIRNAVNLPLAEGLAAERALFIKLRDGAQSKAMRHLFFAERAAQKVRGIFSNTLSRPIERVAILGAGTMGGGIAMSFASAGLPVTLIDPNEAALQRGMGVIETNYRATQKRGGLSEAQVEKALSLIAPKSDMAEVASADLVIEAVFEDMALKKTIFAELERLTRPGTVLATNTSSLDVNEIASSIQRAPDVLGMHFFSPANVMRLLEIVRGEATAPEVLATAIAIGKRIGKVPATVGVCYGFVGNRMLHARGTQVERLLLEGASPKDIDAAATAFGFAMGPCAVGDLAGLDVGWRVRKERGTKAAVADAICEMGRFGQKTGRGYYLYEAGSRAPIPDPEIDQLTARLADEMGIVRRSLSREEITDRLILPLVNEGARILEEGIAERSSDIDLIWINGYGFPVWRGGPLFHADQIGLSGLATKLDFYAAMTGDERLKPAALIKSLAAEGKSFSDFMSADRG